jgi:hypothetical protein
VTPAPAGDAALWAPFRPVRSRRTALAVAVTQAVLVVALGFIVPGAGWIDRVGFVAVAAGFAWVLVRFSLLRAEPRPDGLVVQNLVHRQELDWAQIVAVRLGDGDPWVTLDLSDGDVLAVMAIQRADGPQGLAEARRLAGLVAAHSRPATDD